MPNFIFCGINVYMQGNSTHICGGGGLVAVVSDSCVFVDLQKFFEPSKLHTILCVYDFFFMIFHIRKLRLREVHWFSKIYSSTNQDTNCTGLFAQLYATQCYLRMSQSMRNKANAEDIPTIWHQQRRRPVVRRKKYCVR